MKLSKFASATLLTLGASAMVHAQDGGPAGYDMADKDQDGRLSVAEIQLALPHLAFEDGNGDGYISQTEAEASVEGLHIESTDDDEHISKTEYEAILAFGDEEESRVGSEAGDTDASTPTTGSEAAAGARADN